MSMKAPIRRKGRWVRKVSGSKLCAVISCNRMVSMVRAEELLGWPTYRAFRNEPDFPRGAA